MGVEIVAYVRLARCIPGCRWSNSWHIPRDGELGPLDTVFFAPILIFGTVGSSAHMSQFEQAATSDAGVMSDPVQALSAARRLSEIRP